MAVPYWFRAAVVSNRPPPRRQSRQIGRVERFTCVLTRAGRSCPGSDSGRKKVLRDPACHRPFTAISKLPQGQSLLNPRFPPTILVSLTTSQVLRRPIHFIAKTAFAPTNNIYSFWVPANAVRSARASREPC